MPSPETASLHLKIYFSFTYMYLYVTVWVHAGSMKRNRLQILLELESQVVSRFLRGCEQNLDSLQIQQLSLNHQYFSLAL